jgi:adenylate cyclase
MSGIDPRYFGALSALAGYPGTPSKFTKKYIEEVVIARCNRRIDVLQDRIGDVVEGRVMPDRDDVTIGSGRRFDLAVLFLDICGFSSRPNWLVDEQKIVLKVMNIFMAEMLSIVHDFDGTYEKNTGDGLMAYFGENETSIAACVKPAVEAAVIMHYVNDRLITPWFEQQSVKPVSFRVGIDYGPVTIARVGIHGQKSSLVAIGTAANIANKLMNRIPNGGICIGEEVRANLPNNWGGTCRQCDQPSGFVYVKSGLPYLAWELNHRLSPPLI